jgi:membrane associated rhomboid family serine protease
MFRNLTPMVKNLLIINVAIFVVDNYLLKADLGFYGGLRYIFADQFAPYQFLTHMFLHANGWHLFTNMFALFIFGPLLERFWGAQKFLIFFLVCGMGASVLYSGIKYFENRPLELQAEQYMQDPNFESFNYIIAEHGGNLYNKWYDFIEAYEKNPENPAIIENSRQRIAEFYYAMSNIPMVGASGAIFGILMAFGMLFPNTELMLLFPPIPIKAKYFVTFYGLYELYAGINRVPGDNVAHFAHLGGMLFAFLLLKIWQDQRSNFY